MSQHELLAAGRESFQRRAWADACRQLVEAERHAPLPVDDLERLATAAYLVGDDPRSETSWARAHQLRLDAGEAERAAWCAFWITFGLFHRGAAAPAAGWMARGARLMDDGQLDTALRGYWLMPQGIRQVGADPAAAYATFTEAAQIGERFRDQNLVALATHGRGRALLRQGRVADGLALLDEAMAAVVADVVVPALAGDIYCSVLEACAEIFDVRRGREWTMSMTQWCGTQPELVRYRGECLIYRAQFQQAEGAWSGAFDDAQRACDRLQSPPHPALGMAWYRLGDIHRLRGEFAKADHAYRQATQAGRRPQPGWSLMRLAQGDAQAALGALQTAIAETRRPHQRAQLLPAIVEVGLAVPDLEAARSAVTDLEAVAAALGAAVLSAAASRARGALWLAEGDASSALRVLREACAAWRNLAMPYEEAETHVLIGLSAGALGDTDTRDLEFDAARQQFKRLGADAALARLAALAHPRPTRAANGLSEREVQVLQLVASGQTNRAIADTLFISEKTVARHVSNIFNKLGVSSRSAATAYAFQHRLV
jgi:DNA-binding NarL/FixJ family response regulator